MEVIELEYPTTRAVHGRAHVGIVSSGDLEVLLEPSPTGRGQVRIRTSVIGHREIWEAVMDRFFSKYNRAASIEINDSGATPGTVMLRLDQAVEASEEASEE